MDATEAELIRDVYAAAVGEQPWQAVVETTTRQFDAWSAVLFTLFQPEDRDIRVSLNVPEGLLKQYQAEATIVDLWYHAMVRRYRTLNTGLMCTTDDLVPEKELRRSRFYADYLTPLDFGRGLLTIIGDGTTPDLPFMSLSLYRPPGSEPYSDADKARMGRLQPHFSRAMSLRHHLAHAVRENEALAFERLATAVVVLARDRKVLLANPAAEALFSQCGHALLKEGRLVACDPAQKAALERALQRCASHQLDADVSLTVRLAGAPGSGVVARIAPCPDSAPKSSQAAAIVFVSQEKGSPLDLLALMSALYKLSPAEARLVKMLADGHSLEDFAQARSVGMATVRTQLRSVFAKTGTQGQADLMRLTYSIAH